MEADVDFGRKVPIASQSRSNAPQQKHRYHLIGTGVQ
jgi:hypothetical protein